jgi:hypothetical protein
VFYRAPSRQYRQHQLACQRLDWRYACACVPTDRNEEATCAFTASEEVARKQLQPRIVAVEYYFFILPTLAAATELGKPSILCSEGGGGVALGEVEYEIEERWYGTGGESLDTRHCDCRRSCVGGEGDSRAISDQTTPKSVSIRRPAHQTDIPLHVTHRAVLSKDKIAPQRINNHEDHFVEWRMMFLLAAILFPIRKTRQDRLVWKESSREDEDRNWEEEVGEREASLADAVRKRHGIVQLGARAKASSQRTMSSVLVASEVRQVYQGVDFTSAGWREAENAGDDHRANSTKSAAQGAPSPTITAPAINTDILIGHAANEGFLYVD